MRHVMMILGAACVLSSACADDGGAVHGAPDVGVQDALDAVRDSAGDAAVHDASTDTQADAAEPKGEQCTSDSRCAIGGEGRVCADGFCVEPGSGPAAGECRSTRDCLLDTVCRNGTCVEVECEEVVGGLAEGCVFGEACVPRGFFEYRPDGPHVCSQTFGCPGFWSVETCDHRAYCDRGDPARCPDPTTLFWMESDRRDAKWDCTSERVPPLYRCEAE